MSGCECLNGICKCTRKNTFDWVLLIIIIVLVILALILVIVLWSQTSKCPIKYQKIVVYQPVEIQKNNYSPESLKATTTENKLIYLPEVPEPTFDEPTFDEPTFDEPTFDEPTFDEPTFDEPTFDETIDNSLNIPDLDIVSESPVVQKSFVTSIPNIPTISLDNLANASVSSARTIPIKATKISNNRDIIKGF